MQKSVYHLLLVLIMLFAYSRIFAQDELDLRCDETSNETDISLDKFQQNKFSGESSFHWYDPVTKLPSDFSSFGKEIFDPGSVPAFARLTILTLILMPADHFIAKPLQNEFHQSAAYHNISKSITFIGDGKFHMGIAALFGAAGLITNDSRAMRTALQIVESEITTGLTVQVLKHISGRESPQSASRNGGMFRPFPSISNYHKNQTKYYSFPSGHVSTSMAVLTVIAENYPEIKWIKPVGYGTIGLVGIGLISRGWHWASDYPLALAIGYTFGKIISGRNLHDPENKSERTNLSFQPVLVNGLGFGLIYKF